jgi:hypothetical protein
VQQAVTLGSLTCEEGGNLSTRDLSFIYVSSEGRVGCEFLHLAQPMDAPSSRRSSRSHFYTPGFPRGKRLSIFLQIWTRKYVYIWNLTCTWSDTIHPLRNMHRNAQGDQIFNFQKTFDRPCDEIRMEIQTENFFRSLISMRFIWISRKTKSKKIEYNYQWVFF